MNLFYDQASNDSVQQDISNSLDGSNADTLVDLRNQLRPHEVTFIDADNTLRIYKFSDIEAWGKETGLSYLPCEDIPSAPLVYILNNKISDNEFSCHRDALIDAFNRLMVNPSNPANTLIA